MKVGVFDIGTKAVRLLVGDTKHLIENGFSFDQFNNFGNRTFLGDHIDSDGNLRVKGLERTINVINQFRMEVQNHKIDGFAAVGTAIFRNINNSKDVINIINKNTGLDIRVLSKKEEAKYWICFKSKHGHERGQYVSGIGAVEKFTISALQRHPFYRERIRFDRVGS